MYRVQLLPAARRPRVPLVSIAPATAAPPAVALTLGDSRQMLLLQPQRHRSVGGLALPLRRAQLPPPPSSARAGRTAAARVAATALAPPLLLARRCGGRGRRLLLVAVAQVDRLFRNTSGG